GLVIKTQAPFFLYRVALIVEIRFIDHQTAHAISFDKESQIKLIGRQRFKIGGAIFVSGAVHDATVIEDEIVDLAITDIFRSLEHHMLEQVSEAGAALTLVSRADVVGDVHRNHGSIVILHGDYPQPVGEFGFLEINPRSALG